MRDRSGSASLLAALLPAGAVVLSLWLLSRFGLGRLGVGHPFRWVWMTWVLAFASSACLSQGRARLAAAALAVAAAVLFAGEVYLGGGLAALGLTPSFKPEYESWDSIVYHGPLGYVPVKNSRIASKETLGDKVVYDAVYSIDENGFRKTPALPESSPAAVFLGDSFTFGEGVNDEEAFPAVFQAASGLKAVDLAYRGYGPHQMLRLLETGREIPETARYRPFQGFYLFTHPAVGWAAGNAFWVPDEPRYEVDAHGSLRYRGPWRTRLTTAAIQLLYQSALVRWIWRIDRSADPEWKERDVERFLAIVVELQRVYKRRYRGDFEVLLWDPDFKPEMRRIKELLRRRGVTAVLLTEAVPQIERPESYLLDGHPGAGLHRAVGLYLARRVAERKARFKAER